MVTYDPWLAQAALTAERFVISTNSTITPKRVKLCDMRANVQPYILLLAINTLPLLKYVHNVEAIAAIPLDVTAQASVCSNLAIFFSTISYVGLPKRE